MITDIEQAAEKYADNCSYPQPGKEHFKTTYWIQHSIAVDAFKAGAVWQQSQQPKEAIEISVTGIVQKPSDAVEFAEWISRFGYGKGYGNERDTWFTFNDTVVANSTEKLYQLFKNNP